MTVAISQVPGGHELKEIVKYNMPVYAYCVHIPDSHIVTLLYAWDIQKDQVW